VPVAAVAASAAPVHAEAFLTVQQAQALIFPGATFQRDFIPLSDKQFDLIRDTANVTQWVREIKAWRVSTGGWFLVDEVVGRDDMLFYGIGLSPTGQVIGIEIIQCLPKWDDIRNPAWRRQFAGLRRGQVDPDRIKMISGTSLSSIHITEGVHRVLVTYDLLLKNRR
jgi:hypothetical protein